VLRERETLREITAVTATDDDNEVNSDDDSCGRQSIMTVKRGRERAGKEEEGKTLQERKRLLLRKNE